MLSKLQCPSFEFPLLKMENILYSNVIGSITYVMINTRLDLTFTIYSLSRFMSNLRMEHWRALKCSFRYIASSLDVALCFIKRYDTLLLKGYVDFDFIGGRDSRKSTTTLFFTLSGNCIS